MTTVFWRESFDTVKRFCIERLDIPESDIRSVRAVGMFYAWEVKLWNRRRLVVKKDTLHLAGYPSVSFTVTDGITSGNANAVFAKVRMTGT